jgi:hypothetical protein
MSKTDTSKKAATKAATKATTSTTSGIATKQPQSPPLVSADDPTGGHTNPKGDKETGTKSAEAKLEDKRVEDRKEATDGPRPFPESEANVLGVADNRGTNDTNSLFARIAKSGLFYVEDHIKEQQYIGISPQADPNADATSKAKSKVTGLDVVPPRTGTEVRLADGTSFTIPDGFGMDAKPQDWGAVTNPATGKPLF